MLDILRRNAAILVYDIVFIVMACLPVSRASAAANILVGFSLTVLTFIGVGGSIREKQGKKPYSEEFYHTVTLIAALSGVAGLVSEIFS